MSDRDYDIRDARTEDLDSIYQIELSSFPDPYPRGLLKAFFFIPGSIVVAVSRGEVVGYAIGIIREDDLGHIVSIAVAENIRRRGVGKLLLMELIARLSRSGVKRIVLEVRKSNIEAKRLYHKFGFKKKKEITGYYKDGETAEVMELTL
ncbi:MAG: ribosomal protein S18-alanine N-acetyltransferase [Candidatus Methanosuratincola sp.]